MGASSSSVYIERKLVSFRSGIYYKSLLHSTLLLIPSLVRSDKAVKNSTEVA